MCEEKEDAASKAFTAILESHEPLRRRRAESERRRTQARELIHSAAFFQHAHLTLFVAGSMGRGEMGDRSDLDLFVLTTRPCSEAEQVGLIRGMDEVNAALGYPPFSNRRFLKAYDLEALLRNTGSPEDDSENCFTSRLLLLLESLPLANDETYRQIRDQVLGQYFRDERGKSSYRPLFLLNDVLRYWRTLCLNYEVLRHDPGRPWWKKNINLKFSRVLTVFATVTALTVLEVHAKADFLPMCDLSPHHRLAYALDQLGDRQLRDTYKAFLDDYETFLGWKEDEGIDSRAETSEFQALAQSVADRFSDFLYSVLTHASLPAQRRKYLVI